MQDAQVTKSLHLLITGRACCEKTCWLSSMRTTKAQARLHIHAVRFSPLLFAEYKVYNIQNAFIKMQESPDQTAHPCNLTGAIINHFMTRVTNKIVPRRKRSFAFRVLVSLKMSFKILVISIYVVCRRVAPCGHFTCDSLQH